MDPKVSGKIIIHAQDIPELPDGYTRVPYIENAGNAYIDTGYNHMPGSTYMVDAETFYESSADNGGGQLLGFVSGEDINDEQLCMALSINSQYEVAQLIVGYGSFLTYPILLNQEHRYILEMVTTDTGVSILANGKRVAGAERVYDSYGDVLICTTAPAFREAYFRGRIYGGAILYKGIYKRRFVPCVRNSDALAGLYDVQGSVCSSTNSSFYRSAANNDFKYNG